MESQEKYTLVEAAQEFAKQTNGRVWQLLEQANRTADDDEELLAAAYASLYHWRSAGTEVHRQRGEWLLARVCAVLGEPGLALRHAQRCLEITTACPDQMKDFDRAYAYEGLARALALQGRRAEAGEYLAQAQAAGEAIANSEDRQIFVGDLNGGDWYGVKPVE